MNCMHCNSDNTKKFGKTSSGKQRFVCKDCGKAFTGNSTGRPTIGDRPMTQAERKRRQRQKPQNDQS